MSVILPFRLRKIVAAATCLLPAVKGQGVVIEGNYILTAAHCIKSLSSEDMAHGDRCWVEVKVSGRSFKAETLAIEPRADIAVLGSPDSQAAPSAAFDYDKAIGSVAPLRICRRIPHFGESFPVWIRTHLKKWVGGIGQYFGGSRLTVSAERPIQGGTSGGPIVDAAGELVGVVSIASDEIEGVNGVNVFAPLACLALPVWVMRGLNQEDSVSCGSNKA